MNQIRLPSSDPFPFAARPATSNVITTDARFSLPSCANAMNAVHLVVFLRCSRTIDRIRVIRWDSRISKTP